MFVMMTEDRTADATEPPIALAYQSTLEDSFERIVKFCGKLGVVVSLVRLYGATLTLYRSGLGSLNWMELLIVVAAVGMVIVAVSALVASIACLTHRPS